MGVGDDHQRGTLLELSKILGSDLSSNRSRAIINATGFETPGPGSLNEVLESLKGVSVHAEGSATFCRPPSQS
jgi:hypothetical protein